MTNYGLSTFNLGINGINQAGRPLQKVFNPTAPTSAFTLVPNLKVSDTFSLGVQSPLYGFNLINASFAWYDTGTPIVDSNYVLRGIFTGPGALAQLPCVAF